MEFNEEQLSFINSGLCNLKLLGIPGGGKTRSIIGHIEANIRNKIYGKPSEYLIITFSRRAKDDFLAKGRASSHPRYFTQNNVRTIHSLAGRVNRLLAIGGHHSMGTVVIASKEALMGCSPEQLKELTKIKMIYVDEAQDISEEQYEFIQEFARRINAFVCMVGDPNQSIYSFQGGKPEYLLNFEADKTIQLKVNYRSTSALIDFFNDMLPIRGEHNLMTSVSPQEGAKPTLFAGTVEDILGDILAQIKSTKEDLKGTLIMSSTRFCKENGPFYMNLGLSAVANLLRDNGIKFTRNYSLENDKPERDQKLTLEDGHVNLMTIHGAKGLEFDRVFLLNFQQKGFGIEPTQEDHQNFKYLWYVGMTRAKKELRIYTFDQYVKDVSKPKITICVPFYEFRKVPAKKYLKEGRGELKYRTLFRQSAIPILELSITDLLSNMKAKKEFALETFLMPLCEVSEEDIFSPRTVDIYQHKQYAVLYGLFADAIFEYFYLKHHQQSLEKHSAIKKFNNFKENLVIVPLKYAKECSRLKASFGVGNTNVLNIKDVKMLLSRLNDFSDRNRLMQFVNYLEKKTIDEVYLITESPLMKFPDLEMADLIKELVSETGDAINGFFRLVLFFYQLEYEARYLWNQDFSKNIEALSEHIELIKEFARRPETLAFQVPNKHPRMNIKGRTDIVNDAGEIIEIKFSSAEEISTKWIYQVFLYYNNRDPKWKTPPKLTIWNLLRGVSYTINVNLESSSPEVFLNLLSQISGLPIKSNDLLEMPDLKIELSMML